MEKRLLILDDEPAMLNLLKGLFEDFGFEVMVECDGAKAVERVRHEHLNVALIDIRMPKMSGMEVLREIKKIDPKVCVIMMTGHQTTNNAIEAMKLGAYDYLTKPLNLRQLPALIEEAYKSSLLTRGISIVTEELSAEEQEKTETDFMIGSTREMIEIWKMVGRIADTDAAVLIQGESGTGKELLARSIYSNSRRSDKPFLAVNCAALPENLLESELFGHEKGAFTDAFRQHIGRFEQCNGGTIFLDEIAEMALSNQSKLLRVLENQEITRLGGKETIKIDVRIIAATNRSLIAAVKEKKFRIDLYYRLKVVNFFLPPLRDRQEDIPTIANHFLKKFARENHKSIAKIAPESMQLLMAASWPGNIRELKNIIHAAAVICKGDTLLPEDLDSQWQGTTSKTDDLPEDTSPDYCSIFKPLFDVVSQDNDGAVFENYISVAEKALFRLTMERCKNNELQASKFLGISRNTLRQRLKLYQ